MRRRPGAVTGREDSAKARAGAAAGRPSRARPRLPASRSLTRTSHRAARDDRRARTVLRGYLDVGRGAPRASGAEDAMRIAIAGDHAGFELKRRLAEHLRRAGHEVLDLGGFDASPSDYPDHAEAVGLAVVEGRAERGLLVCGSGVGVAVAASKSPGVRAAMCHDHYSAHQGVEHDDLNVLALGARVVGPELALELA